MPNPFNPLNPVTALSTMWGVGRYESLKGLWAKAQELGFTHLELNYQVTPEMLSEFLGAALRQALRQGSGQAQGGGDSKDSPIPISSVHAPCPWAEHQGQEVRRIPLNSMDDELYQVVLSHHKASIDLAVRLGAGLVVVHAGSVAPLEALERRMRALHSEGQASSPEYRVLWEQLVASRSATKAPYVEKALAALWELASYARERGVRLGLENRFYFFEVPDVDEMALFLDELGDAAGHWHDTGHAANLDRLGFVRHDTWLERLGPRIIGVHLHDIDGLRDHQAPGGGSLDWAKLAPYLPATAVRVLEINNDQSEAQLRRGLTVLQKEGILAPIEATNEEP